MNKVQEFLNDNFGEVRCCEENGVILFVAADIAKVLNYTTTQKVTDKVDDEDKGYRTWVTNKGEQKLVVITEGALYQVVGTITKKDKDRYAYSRDFKRWVTNEIIPTIRNTGAYVEDTREDEAINKYFPSFSEDVKLAMVQDLLKTNKQLKTKADKWNKFLDSNGTYSFTEVSKLISTMAVEEKSDISISVIKLTEFLRDKGVLSKAKSPDKEKENGHIKKGSYKNLPNKKYEDYFNVTSIHIKDNLDKTQTKVKAMGVEFIYDLVKKEYKAV